MSGYKTIINNSSYTLLVTVLVRAGLDPKQLYGTRELVLEANQEQGFSFGDEKNAYLNGLVIRARKKNVKITHELVVKRENSDLDNKLNRFQMISINSIEPFKFISFD